MFRIRTGHRGRQTFVVYRENLMTGEIIPCTTTDRDRAQKFEDEDNCQQEIAKLPGSLRMGCHPERIYNFNA